MFLNLPNLLTIGRLILVPFVIRELWLRDFRLALTLVFVAGATDAVDGFLARHFNSTTRVGAYLDPVADKLLLVSVYVMLAVDAAVPVWLVGMVLSRDVLI
ncbi:MAG: CDP-alcohol phosphatidyltransferase family protein, partial [Acidobacteriota bacterium]|nr:CDP-alcohol phosphatidyltransferase family protein [Acidobacteriota bacterium]